MFTQNINFDDNRRVASQECCDLLKEYFKKHPYIRFSQAIRNFEEIYGMSFYEEPQKTIEKLKKFVKD